MTQEKEESVGVAPRVIGAPFIPLSVQRRVKSQCALNGAESGFAPDIIIREAARQEHSLTQEQMHVGVVPRITNAPFIPLPVQRRVKSYYPHGAELDITTNQVVPVEHSCIQEEVESVGVVLDLISETKSL